MGGLSIFRKPYTIRRFGEQEIISGYATSSYEDLTAILNVQPLSADELQALPEGERQIKRLKSFGDFEFRAADQKAGTPGDWLYYYGQWYKCVSSLIWDHTMLCHCNAEFVAVSETDSSFGLTGEEGTEWM